MRGLERLAEVSRANGETELTLTYPADVLDIDPFREPDDQRLMRLHADAGNRAEALRLFGAAAHS